jgi:hypothetical protein
MGWIAACILVVLMLPLLGILYMDVLQTKHEAKQKIEKMGQYKNQSKHR